MNRHKETPSYQTSRSSSGFLKKNQRPRIRRCTRLGLFIIPLLLFTACGGNSGAVWGPGSTQGNNSTQSIVNRGGLIILAAPTFQLVLPSLVEAFLRSRHLNVPYVFDFSGAKLVTSTTNTLADADVLINDEQQAMVNARYLGFTTSNGIVIATDTLNVILPASNPGQITTLQDLAVPGHRYLAIANYDGLTVHIQTTLEAMNLDPTFTIHYAARVYGNITATYTDGISATRALAQSPPQGDVTIAYHTNYLAVQKEQAGKALTELSIPRQFNPPIDMLAAVAGQSHHPALAQQLIDYLHSASASLIWRQFGFTPVS